MVINDEKRGIEYHIKLDADGKIQSIEMIFAEPRDLGCILRPEGLFAPPCGGRPHFVPTNRR